MKKSQKILLSTLLPVSLAGVCSTVLLATSCSSTTEDKFNEQTFKDNGNKRYMDLTGTKLESKNDRMETVNLSKAILGTKDGMKQYMETYSDTFLVDWFSKTTDPILSTFYNDELKTIQDEFKESKKSYTDMNLFQREVLDPTGGTENTYIFQKLLPKLKDELSTSLFAKDYLGINDGGNIIKLDPQSNEALNALQNKDNINGKNGSGTRNKFEFNAHAATSYNAFDDYYVDFINFIFEEWTKETLPIVTPTVLFKHASGVSPKDCGLFNISEFGATALEGTDSNYKFQWFEPANNDYMNPNTAMKYKTFVANKDSFINNDTGAIQIDKYLTDDRSTLLITNGKTGYTDFVTPFAAASLYNFSDLVLGTTTKAAFPSDTLKADDIMSNFINKSTTKATGDFFTLPYETKDAFSGAYTGVKGIRDTFKVANTPFVATRDEFGVHIIGIDRYEKIKEAISSKNSAQEKMDAAIVEIQNTILWRAAQRTMLESNDDVDKIDLDIKSTLKSYFDSNVSKLIFKYLLKNKDTNASKEEVNTPSKHLFSQETIENGKTLINILDNNNPKYKLMEAILEVDKVQASMEFIKTVNEKVYGNQANYSTNQKISDWKTFGLAGVLPYERNEKTADFDQLINMSVKPLEKSQTSYTTTNIGDSIDTIYTNAKTKLSSVIQGLNISPATTENYFKDTVGKQLGISQYTFVNDWNINQILTKDASDTTVVDIYNALWDENNVDADLINSLKQTTKVETTNAFNKSVADQLKEQINTNYVIRNAFDSQSQKAETYLDFSDYTQLESTAKSWVKEKFTSNQLGANGQISYAANSEFKTFLKTLTWLLSPAEKTSENTNTNYTFENLIKLLKEIIDNEDTGVAYLGWTSESTTFAGDSFGSNVQKDFEYKKNPMYITNMNSYSYWGATNPTDSSLKQDTYYGNNSQNYFNTAKIKKDATNSYETAANNSKGYNGFIGFQSSDSTLFTSSLPSELYTGQLLTQDPQGNHNFKGLFYRFNKGDATSTYANAQASKQNMKDYYKEDSFKLTTIAKQVELYGLGILNKNINWENSSYTIKQALKMVIDGATITNNPLSVEQRTTIMNSIVDEVPEVVFQQINGESLSKTKNGKSTTVFDNSNGNLSQYIVSQFNMNDILKFEESLKTANNASSLNFANLDMSTFYAAIVLLAQNVEVQSRSTAHWTSVSKENKVTVYNYNVAKKLGETVVKNWDDFNK